MKSFSLSIEDRLLDAARRKATRENTTLDELLRGWLQDYAGDERVEESCCAAGCRTTPEERKARTERVMTAIRELREHIDTSGPKPTRDEMNARGARH